MIEIIEQTIANYTAEITKRAETAEKQLKLAEKSLFVKDKRIVELEQTLIEKDKKIKELEAHLTVVKNVNEKWKNIHIADRVRITEVEQTIKKYASALKDFEGTLCAAYDHLMELSNSIYTIVK